MATTSCNTPNPIVNWQSDGVGPTLKYNLPQGTTLTPVARIPLSIELDKFKPEWSVKPTINFWDTIAALHIDNLGRDIVTDLMQNVNNSQFIANVQAVTLAPSMHSPNMALKVDGGGGIGAKKMGMKTPLPMKKGVKLNSTVGDELPTIELGGQEMNVDFLVKNIKEGLMPIARRTFGGTTKIEFVKQPATPIPRLYIIEEYRINSYLGNYGAGKILKTFTLLPGEKTTITMRTFKQITSKSTMSQNVLESVSSDVVDSLETFLQDERQNSASSSASTSESFSLDVSAGCDLGFVSASVDVGYQSSSSSDQSRTDAVNSLNNSMDKHTAQSNTNREINVNNSTEDTSTSETEETIVRQLENINYSRVLNFIFRQMQQQYISVTTLNNIKVLFTNGYPESVKITSIEKLKDLLNDVIVEADVDEVYEDIINEYCKIRNYEGELKSFLTNVSYTDDDPCIGSGEKIVDFWTANGATDSFDFLGSPFEVDGIILQIKERTLQTDSAVCDTLLGQMDALDCFNMKLQDAEASKATTQAEIMTLYKEMMDEATGSDKIELAKIIGRILTKCCDVPQSTSGCGCGSNDAIELESDT
jgi:hypothetical protein